jgi:dsRNA-specific ribonuclease
MSITLCSHKNLGHQPKYECDAGLGPSHQRRFTCTVSFPGVDDISAVGTQKKFAESWAAFKMYKQLEKLPDVPKVEKDECC